MTTEIIIEYYAEPLGRTDGKIQRGQLYQAMIIDGEEIPELSHKVGSPAPWETVKAHEKVIRV